MAFFYHFILPGFFVLGLITSFDWVKSTGHNLEYGYFLFVALAVLLITTHWYFGKRMKALRQQKMTTFQKVLFGIFMVPLFGIIISI